MYVCMCTVCVWFVTTDSCPEVMGSIWHNPQWGKDCYQRAWPGLEEGLAGKPFVPGLSYSFVRVLNLPLPSKNIDVCSWKRNILRTGI